MCARFKKKKHWVPVWCQLPEAAQRDIVHMSSRLPKNIFMYFRVGQSLGPCLWGYAGYTCWRKTERCRSGLGAPAFRRPCPAPLGSECQKAANLICSHRTRICKRPSVLLKISFKSLVWCLGLYAVFITVVGFPCAVEGARTRNLGRRGLSGSQLTSGIAHGRKLQAHRGSGEQMEHVSHS